MAASDTPSVEEKGNQPTTTEAEYSKPLKDEESSRDATTEEHAHSNKASILIIMYGVCEVAYHLDSLRFAASWHLLLWHSVGQVAKCHRIFTVRYFTITQRITKVAHHKLFNRWNCSHHLRRYWRSR